MECYEIELEDGKMITCTGEHRFMCEDGEFRTLDNIMEEDVHSIAVER